jgi:phthalate 4,5-dioxygenase
MGPIADRTHDTLGGSDIAIVQFRTRMLNALRAELDDSLVDERLDMLYPMTSIRSFSGVVPKDVDWRTLAVDDEERATYIDRRPLVRASA